MTTALVGQVWLRLNSHALTTIPFSLLLTGLIALTIRRGSPSPHRIT
ncbi:hypothetical protein [Kocuria nitroreducens]